MMEDPFTCQHCGRLRYKGDGFAPHCPKREGGCKPAAPLSASPTPPERYFLDTDNDSHWYVIPVARRSEWSAFLDIPEDDERSWEVPTWARPVGGSPSQVSFTEPEGA